MRYEPYLSIWECPIIAEFAVGADAVWRGEDSHKSATPHNICEESILSWWRSTNIGRVNSYSDHRYHRYSSYFSWLVLFQHQENFQSELEKDKFL